MSASATDGSPTPRLPLVAATLVVGIFLMHGLQILCQDGRLDGHRLIHTTTMDASTMVDAGVRDSAESMHTVTAAGALTTSERQPGGPFEARSALALCVAILGGGLLLGLILQRRRSIDQPVLSPATAGQPFRQLARSPPRFQAPQLSVLCVSRT